MDGFEAEIGGHSHSRDFNIKELFVLSDGVNCRAKLPLIVVGSVS